MTALDLSVCCSGDIDLLRFGDIPNGIAVVECKGSGTWGWWWSNGVDVTQEPRGKVYVPGQEHWTKPALLSHLSHNLKLSLPVLGPLWTHLSSRDAPLPARLGSRGL